MRFLIFHLNILADANLIRRQYQSALAQMLGSQFGDEKAWFEAYEQILADWDSYHADLNFAGDDGMADMREARFRVMRALFRLRKKPEPSQDEIHGLVDESFAYITGNVFFPESQILLNQLAENYQICLVAYFSERQLKAIVKAGHLSEKLQHCIGADTLEQYEMNHRYFELLLNHLKIKAENCLYVDKQAKVLETTAKIDMQTFPISQTQNLQTWQADFLKMLRKSPQNFA